MIEAGRARIGETVALFHLGHITTARITAPCHFDPEGTRLNG